MSLGDIFVEILGEMMGVPIKKKTPPSASRPVAPPPVEDDDVYMYDDEGEENRYEVVHREEEPARRPEIPSTVMAAVESYEPQQRATRRIPIHQEPRRSSTKAVPVGLPDGFVQSIRTDKAAARAAIVSAEIFGPPVSERRDRQW